VDGAHQQWRRERQQRNNTIIVKETMNSKRITGSDGRRMTVAASLRLFIPK